MTQRARIDFTHSCAVGLGLFLAVAASQEGWLTVYAPDGEALGLFMSSAATSAGRVILSDKSGPIAVEAGTMPKAAESFAPGLVGMGRRGSRVADYARHRLSKGSKTTL